ncbi:MAG: type I methionyl aminopeptidase [Chloroflexi bacterium]|nr:type I methionyl aminopeptidase [Chloroflexota bacterium]
MLQAGINLKSPRELEHMRQAGQVVAHIIDVLARAVHPGIRTGELDAIAERETRAMGALPSFKGYRGYPATICVSVNEEIVHGIPGKRVLKEGDIVGIDVGAIVNGYQGDAAVTVGVGRISPQAQRLMDTTRNALEAGIQAAKAGNRIGDISWAIQRSAEAQGFSVVREYVGHGIGRALHEEPAIPNFGEPGKGIILRPGMAMALEPMVNVGTWRTRVKSDNWTVVTLDGSLSAHFEHTIAIRDGGPEVLTRLNGVGR